MTNYIGPVSATNTTVPIPLQCHTAAGVADNPTGTPTYRVYGPSFGAALTGGTGNAAAANVDSQTGFRPFTIDLTAITGITAGELYTVRCSSVVSGSTIIDSFTFLAQ